MNGGMKSHKTISSKRLNYSIIEVNNGLKPFEILQKKVVAEYCFIRFKYYDAKIPCFDVL